MNTKRLLPASILGLGLTLGLVWLLGASFATAAPTANLAVTKLSDSADGNCDSDCSLREAIIAANDNSGHDTITLALVGTYDLTIAGQTEGAAATGDLDISDDVTIVGQGPGATIVDANGIDRVLSIQGSTVVISGVTIMGGGGMVGGGGGIYNSGGDLSLINVAVISNSAVFFGGAGGGIRLAGSDAALTMDENSILARNEAYGGGGVAVVDGAEVLLSGGRIVSNSATLGGGVSVSQGSVTLSGTQIFSNTADSSGGGMYVDGAATLGAGSILSNTASNYGGGVYVSGSFTQTGTSIIGHNTAGRGGGGLHVQSGLATLNGGQIVDNATTGTGDDAYGGGGAYVNLDSAALVQNSGSTIVGNLVETHGGGVYVSAGRATLSGGQIVSNTAGEKGGGVFLYGSPAAFTQTAGLIAHNAANGSASDDGGGGIYAYFGGSRLTLSGGQVLDNRADRGGGLYVRLGSFDLDGGQIIDNRADLFGGGIYAGLVGWSTELEGAQIISNTAEYGGGLYAVAGDVTLERGQIISNTANETGGGVHHNTGGSAGALTLINTTVSGNYASSDGGALFNSSGTMVLTHTTVASNTSDVTGYGIQKTGGSILAKNTIVAYNSPWNCDSGALTSQGTNIASDFTCSLTQTGDKHGVDPELAPLAYDQGTLVHAIAQGSPAHDAGVCQAGITIDQRGLPRFAPCDMGAYEYVHAQIYLPVVLKNS